MSYLDIKCCKCGASYFTIRYSMSTAMWSPTVIKDGKIISYNPNHETHYCQCIACGAFFNVTEHNGMIESVEVVDGFAAPSQLSYETVSIDAEELKRQTSENVKRWVSVAEENYNNRVLSIKKDIVELESKLSNGQHE